MSVENFINPPVFLKCRPILSLDKKVPIFFEHGWEKGRFYVCWKFWSTLPDSSLGIGLTANSRKIAPPAPWKRVIFPTESNWENIWNPKFSWSLNFCVILKPIKGEKKEKKNIGAKYDLYTLK